MGPSPYGSGLRASFVREGRIGTLVRHPNLVRVVDVGKVDDQPFIAMQLVDGCTAGALSTGSRQLGPGAWLELASQAALGLAALHDAGQAGEVGSPLLHLDIKPSNLLLDRSGCVKLADYGLSELMGRGKTQVVEGTPGYMSSEQFTGEALGPRSDLFSLGVTLYNLLTGERLLPSFPLSDALSAVHRLDDRLDDPTVWAAVEARVPGASTVLKQCLRRDPNQRYANAHALWAALSRLRPEGDPGPGLAAMVDRMAHGPSRWRPRLPPSRPFVGRLQECTRVRRAAARAPLTWITGVEGIGKSVLARHALHGATWVPADDIATPEGLAQRTLRALNLSREADLLQLLPLIPARTIVVDGLDTEAEGLVSTLQTWSAAAPEWRWVATTRGPPPASTDRADVLALDPLDPASATDLLCRYVPDLSTEEAYELALKVHRHPVNLEVMGHALASGVSPPDALQTAHRAHTSGSAVRWSLEEVPRSDQRVLAQLLALRGAFGLAEAEAVVTDSNHQLGHTIEGLVRRGLLVDSGARMAIPPRTRMELDALRPAVLSPREHRALTLRHAMHFSQMGTLEGLQDLWGPLGQEVLERLVDAKDDLQAALDAALVVRAATTAARCLVALLAISSAGRGSSPRTEDLDAVLHHRALEPTEKIRLLLWAVYEWNDGEEVIVVRRAREAVTAARALGDRGLEGAAQTALGSILVSTSTLDAAHAPIASGRAIAIERGDRRAEYRALLEKARLLGRKGSLSDAVVTLDEAINLAEPLQDAATLPWLRALRALMWARMGRHFDAAEALTEAAEEFEVNGWWSRASSAWANVAFALQSRDATAAMHAITRAHRFLLQSGNVTQAASSRLVAAALLVELGRADEASALFDELTDLARSTGAIDRERSILSVRVGQACILNDWNALGPLLQEAERLEVVDRFKVHTALIAYATARRALAFADEDAARDALADLRVERDAGRIENARWMHDDVDGRIAAAQGASAVAEACLERALELACAADPFGACEVLLALVDVLLHRGRAARAQELVEHVTITVGPHLHPASPGQQRLQAAADRLAAPIPSATKAPSPLQSARTLFDQATIIDPNSR